MSSRSWSARSLGAGLKIERITIREPDLTDVFVLFTGQALDTEKENA